MSFAMLLGLASGALSIAADRFALLGWFALAPLALATHWSSPRQAAIAAAIAAIVGSVGAVMSANQRALIPVVVLVNGLAYAVGFGGVTLAMRQLPAAWSVVLIPAVSIAAILPLRIAGAPRWLTNVLACSQERWLPVVHIARLGGDLVVTLLLALASATLALLIASSLDGWRASDRCAAGVSVAIIAAALAYGTKSCRAAVERSASATRVRIAAVVVDDPKRDELAPNDAASDLAATVRCYEPQVRQAAAAGAEIIVLPEVAAQVNATSRASWLEAAASWAQHERVVIIAPYFDASSQRNELVILDTTGTEVGRYEKQHPGPMEPKAQMRMAPGPFTVKTRERILSLSTVICVDLDYGDLVSPVHAVGGVLIAPANDWPRFELMHHRTAVWAAVLSGVPVVRATGHGTSAVFDGAGRVLARQSSWNGPVTLLVDVPLAAPRRPPRAFSDM